MLAVIVAVQARKYLLQSSLTLSCGLHLQDPGLQSAHVINSKGRKSRSAPPSTNEKKQSPALIKDKKKAERQAARAARRQATEVMLPSISVHVSVPTVRTMETFSAPVLPLHTCL